MALSVVKQQKLTLEAEAKEAKKAQDIAALEAERDGLIERLDKGAVQIEAGRAKGKDVQEWEDYWIRLLRQYEAICDKLRELTRV